MNQLNFFRNLIVCSLLGAALLYAFDGYFDRRFPVVGFLPKTGAFVMNPLDAVVGEKKWDDGSFRADNFEEILHINASFLKDSSELYTVHELAKDLFLLTRKKFFYGNRKYSLFVKTHDNEIVQYHPTIDFPISGAVYSDRKIYFIGDDYKGITNDLQSTYVVKINCMNLNFEEEWSTVSKPNSYYFFYGNGLKHQNDTLVAGIIIRNAGGSSMCVDYYNLFLSEKGKALHSMFLGTDACTGKNTELGEISSLFE